MPTKQTTDDLYGYIPRPIEGVGKHMVSVTKKDHERIKELAEKYDTSNGRVITALLNFYFDE